MLEPLNGLTKSKEFPFVDATVFVRTQEEAGFSLTSTWGYQFEPFFQGVEEKETETHKKFNLLSIIGMSQYTVTGDFHSRIDQAFGKSWNLRYVMNLVGQIHQPMRNIIRFSNAFQDGDNFGKDQKISISGYQNLFDLFEDALGQYKSLNYPLSSTSILDTYVDQIMKDFPESELGCKLNFINIFSSSN